jgi:hypothetical protein
LEDFPIVEFAHSIGKNTQKLTLWDMLTFYSQLAKRSVKGGERKRVYRIEKISYFRNRKEEVCQRKK